LFEPTVEAPQQLRSFKVIILVLEKQQQSFLISHFHRWKKKKKDLNRFDNSSKKVRSACEYFVEHLLSGKKGGVKKKYKKKKNSIFLPFFGNILTLTSKSVKNVPKRGRALFSFFEVCTKSRI
jgi:hypothetical protein